MTDLNEPIVWPDGITPNTLDNLDSIGRHARISASAFGLANNVALARSRWLVGTGSRVMPSHVRRDCFKRDGERALIVMHGVREPATWPEDVIVERLPFSWWKARNAYAVRDRQGQRLGT